MRCVDCGMKEAPHEQELCDECYENNNTDTVIYKIPWQKYEPTDRSILRHVLYLVTDGKQPMIAVHAKRLDGDGYGWHRQGGYSINGVTHWAPINLPEGEG